LTAAKSSSRVAAARRDTRRALDRQRVAHVLKAHAVAVALAQEAALLVVAPLEGVREGGLDGLAITRAGAALGLRRRPATAPARFTLAVAVVVAPSACWA
jgi:hypothetical protein